MQETKIDNYGCTVGCEKYWWRLLFLLFFLFFLIRNLKLTLARIENWELRIMNILLVVRNGVPMKIFFFLFLLCRNSRLKTETWAALLIVENDTNKGYSNKEKLLFHRNSRSRPHKCKFYKIYRYALIFQFLEYINLFLLTVRKMSKLQRNSRIQRQIIFYFYSHTIIPNSYSSI